MSRWSAPRNARAPTGSTSVGSASRSNVSSRTRSKTWPGATTWSCSTIRTSATRWPATACSRSHRCSTPPRSPPGARRASPIPSTTTTTPAPPPHSAHTTAPASTTYTYRAAPWAAPLDAATQVAAAREDRLDCPLPQQWSEVLALARRQPVCLSLAGPHAALSLFSMAAAHGDAPAASEPGRLFAGEGAVAAWELLSELHALAFRGCSALNPIGILDAMARNAEAEYGQLRYG